MYRSIRTLSACSFAATIVVMAGGCHQDIAAKETGSATDEKDLFGESETDSADSGIPTTSASDTGWALLIVSLFTACGDSLCGLDPAPACSRAGRSDPGA